MCFCQSVWSRAWPAAHPARTGEAASALLAAPALGEFCELLQYQLSAGASHPQPVVLCKAQAGGWDAQRAWLANSHTLVGNAGLKLAPGRAPLQIRRLDQVS